jgi:chromosome segregation ATPase
MNSKKHPKTDPAVLLLNEIEILSAQMRLLELYTKQAQSAALIEVAQIRDHYEGELAAARQELQKAAQELESERIRAREADDNLRAEIRSLQAQLAEQQALLDRHSAEATDARSERTALAQQIAELQAAKQEVEFVAAATAENLKQQFAAQTTGKRSQSTPRSKLRANSRSTGTTRGRANILRT